jgi:hypothetical protein
MILLHPWRLAPNQMKYAILRYCGIGSVEILWETKWEDIT